MRDSWHPVTGRDGGSLFAMIKAPDPVPVLPEAPLMM